MGDREGAGGGAGGAGEAPPQEASRGEEPDSGKYLLAGVVVATVLLAVTFVWVRRAYR